MDRAKLGKDLDVSSKLRRENWDLGTFELTYPMHFLRTGRFSFKRNFACLVKKLTFLALYYEKIRRGALSGQKLLPSHNSLCAVFATFNENTK